MQRNDGSNHANRLKRVVKSFEELVHGLHRLDRVLDRAQPGRLCFQRRLQGEW